MIKILIKSTRITWASKNVNAYLLALTYAYFSGIPITNPYEILEGLLLVSVLWGALYSLNDLTDLDIDRKDHTKRNRAFIQNDIDKKWIVIFCGSLIIAVFIVSLATLKSLFTIILGLMLLNQIIYTLPPLRLKDTIIAPFASTATNTVLRIASCCVLLGNVLIVPISVYLFMYIAAMCTYTMYKSKIVAASILGVLSGILLSYIMLSGQMNYVQLIIVILPALLAGIPLYLSLFKDKEKMTRLADIGYHQVAMVFFFLCILIILF
ncbi:UbiA family prenyltransferase [Methanobacterium oryzae]|uniref:UbiA family prenyltransferase n=1 Tax=Methanobacterium oryzae TaxID=69540 RepID=UPI003D24027E